ncbi:MAG: choice-of-anchor J domain-containing protein [Bacteroidota bacterium]|nr:choice-of-anchor J domain-containing protein [Bacteroidota bacterium]
MKKFTFLFLLLVAFNATGFSQKKQDDFSGPRCGTMQNVEQMFKRNPQLKTFAEQMSKVIPAGPSVKNYRTNTIVTIPVVVHIVLNNPNIVSDADVQWQIDKLNLDYSGLNTDSTNIPPEFQAVRGHSQIRFALARRTPAGILTNGIERITSSAGSNVNLSTDPIKHSAQGGADIWNPGSYLNLWVGNDASGQGILGYAQFPSSGRLADDGVFINVRGWANNPCYTLPAYNLGRTAVHEVGHYFGLLHNWGDDGSACTGDDFANLSSVGSSCSLPTGLFNPAGQGNTASDIGDTPNQAGSSSGLCPSGIKTDACSPSSPGIMYQDYMDYTNDACYSMFTKKQVERMEWVLDNCRASLKTSSGATIPSGAVTIDASPVQSVNPGGSEVVGCTSVDYVSVVPCSGSLTPKVRIRNNGLNTLNTVTVGMIINGGTPVTVNISPNLPFGYTTVVSFPSVNVASGVYTIKFYTKNPNGVDPDQVPSNDTLTTTLTVANPSPLPIAEGFETNPFPPSGWTIFNPNGDNTWVKVSPGHNSNYSAAIDNYNNNFPGRIDELRTPKLTFTPADSTIIISFDVAYKNYPDVTNYDTLSVLVSPDCGATFTTIYKKFGPTLATDTSSSAFITPVESDWRTEKITLKGALLSSGNIIVAFRNTNRFGNNIFLDNINIAPPGPGDLKLVSIDQPGAFICSTSVTPSVTVQNIGNETVDHFDVSYSVDNAAFSTTTFAGLNLLPNQQMNIILSPLFTVTQGAHVIKVYISNLGTINGSPDLNRLNDTLTKTFTLVGRLTVPVTQGFESTVFPPAGWGVDNPDNSLTWERTTLAAKSGIASMVIRNYDYANVNTIDRFASPVITNFANFDSLFVSFDLAYTSSNNTNPPDTLELQVTRDCGQSFTTVWKKWGVDLQTTTTARDTRFIPTTNDWKNINILLTPYVNTPSFQLYFVAKSNKQNNLYIDNINIYGTSLPQRLKDQGYEIYPNPFRGSFLIHHFFPPVTLQNISIYNSVGQKVWEQQLNGQGSGQINVDLSNVSSGIYIVNLTYRDRVIVERVVKN